MKHRLGEGPERMDAPRWEPLSAPGCWIVVAVAVAVFLWFR